MITTSNGHLFALCPPASCWRTHGEQLGIDMFHNHLGALATARDINERLGRKAKRVIFAKDHFMVVDALPAPLPRTVYVVESVDHRRQVTGLLYVVDTMETVAQVTRQLLSGWRRGTDHVWETRTPDPLRSLRATPRVLIEAP